MRRFEICILSVFISGFLWSKAPDNDLPVITDVYDMTLRVHKAGNIQFSVTNYGELGSRGGDIHPPPPDSFAHTPSLEFPRNSDIEYLFMAPIWIGARIEDDDNPGQFDTLVSIGNDCWWSGVMELIPPGNGHESMWRQRLIGDEEYVAEYYDTALTGVMPDPIDGRPHSPLGLKINQHSYCWSTTGYDEFIIIEYALENIYDHYLQDVWFGVLFDGDAFHWSENPFAPEEGAQDDLSGFIEYNSSGIAWIIDNNGQPYNGGFTDSSVTGVAGLMLAYSSSPGLLTSFNWWIPDVRSQYDWGPQLQANYNGPFPGGGNGTPGGDVAKYRVMSNSERDYDQAYCALDWTDEGWIESNLLDSSNVANGFDTRFLISWGPFDISPGGIETLTIAVLAGHNLHTDPTNYANHLQYLTEDSLSIHEFYSNLDFSDLLAKSDTVMTYINNLQTIPIGHPDNFAISSWSDTLITLSWSELNHPLFREFRLYKGVEPGVYDTVAITPGNFTDTVFYDYDMLDNTDYFYVISVANDQLLEGGFSSQVTINSGQPQIPSNLNASGGDSEIQITWDANPDDDMQGYIIFRNSPYEPEGEFVIIDTTSQTAYIDMNIINGYTYRYALQALDIYANLSPASDTVSAIAVNQGTDILFVHANVSNPELNPDYQSMMEFYYNLLENTTYNFTLINREPYNLVELANHGILIWCRDLPFSTISFGASEELIAQYLDIGGKLILAGPRNLVTTTFEGNMQFQAGDFACDYFNINGLEYPSIMSTEFVGGESADILFPDFSLDTSRTNRIVIPDTTNEGRLFGMGVITPADSLKVIYRFVAVEPDTSTYHGRPIALIHHDEDCHTAYLEFPLYYIEQGRAFEIFNQVLDVINNVSIDEEPAATLPEKTSLLYNYPNPFNSITTIRYELHQAADVTIEIYDLLGRKVESLLAGKQDAGQLSITWDAGDLPSGVYFCRLHAGVVHVSGRMLLLK